MIFIIFFAATVPRSSSASTTQPALSKKEATHERILEVASRALRRHGLDGVGVADVMKEAGLTHGGFYAHFESREALLAEALARVRRDMAAVIARRVAQQRAGQRSAFRVLIESYLASANLSAFETACPVAALGSELARCTQPGPQRSDTLQTAARDLATDLIGGVRKALPEAVPATAAPVIASTLVGALQLARMLADQPKEAEAVLASARSALLNQYDVPACGN
ncbi:TetR/AcrR family transcriptional regulator [Paraburkholderia acidisoli]|uniref:TetR family transcriptional regulator n=1 Tax=Paraburkholderia acidisoli TaxID=2571748 RepID=A0A7Z2JJS7_9BURK|nr:TetR/AcrR family transcriptional regulator [Paraburkholderia acidisoli]QGZ65604.1 TetR family transcriptional regulator [Paraburkholderia acidisoli]